MQIMKEKDALGTLVKLKSRKKSPIFYIDYIQYRDSIGRKRPFPIVIRQKYGPIPKLAIRVAWRQLKLYTPKGK